MFIVFSDNNILKNTIVQFRMQIYAYAEFYSTALTSNMELKDKRCSRPALWRKKQKTKVNIHIVKIVAIRDEAKTPIVVTLANHYTTLNRYIEI